MSHLGDRLAGYVDGELSAAGQASVMAHLRLCGSCRAAVAQEQRTKDGLADLGGPAPSASLMNSLFELKGPDGPSYLQRPNSPLVAPNPRRMPGPTWLLAGAAGVAAITVAAGMSVANNPRPAHHGPHVATTNGLLPSRVGVVGVSRTAAPHAAAPRTARSSASVPLGGRDALSVELVSDH